jgi:hypothetical protein
MQHVGFLWDKSKSFFFCLPHSGYELYSRAVECKSGTTKRRLMWSIYSHTRTPPIYMLEAKFLRTERLILEGEILFLNFVELSLPFQTSQAAMCTVF